MAIERAMEPMAYGQMGEEPIEVEIGEEYSVQEPEAPSQPDHYANLAEYIDDPDLDLLGKYLINCFDSDENSRKDWLNTYIKGLDYLGFSLDDRTRPFKGASGVYHPVMAEAVVRFQSNAIGEIFPASGPVLTKVLGAETPEKIAQAGRIKEELNYQLTENMCEYRSEMEKLLFRLPLSGSVFKKIYFDPLKKRPAAMMVPAEDFVIDYNSSELETSERHCHINRRSNNEVKKLMRSGFYRSIELSDPMPYHSQGKEKEDKLKGMQPSIDGKDTRRTILEFCVHYNLPKPFDDPDGVADPYVIAVDHTTNKVLSIRRNWKPNDQSRNPEQYYVHYEYMPGLGFYAFGLVHLMGSVAKSATSLLRQLIDAGTLATLPGGLKTRGLRTKNGDQPIQPGEWRDVDVPAGKISENLFPLPYKEPSSTLFALLGNIVDEGRRIGSIADLEIGSASQNAPVGTTLALMERSLKVMSAVHARLHASLKRELKMVAVVIADYMPPQYEWDETQQFNRRQDFDARVDVIPVSDPNAATQAQKIVQLQAVMQLAQQNPELYNLKELHRKGLQAIGIKDDERILPVDQPPPRLDPVQENMAFLTSQPTKVYQDQDHAAHLQVHIAALMDPKIMELVGQSPNAPKIQGAMEAHIAEHLAFAYRDEIEQQMGVQLPPMGEELPPEVEARLSRLIAEAASRLREAHVREMQQKQNEQIVNDPVFQLREREVANKERDTLHKIEKDNKQFIMDIAKAVSAEMLELRRIESEETRAGAKIGADLVTFGAQLESEERREGVTLGKEISENIRSDARDVQKMNQEAIERENDRIHQKEIEEKKLQAAKAKAAARPKPKAK